MDKEIEIDQVFSGNNDESGSLEQEEVIQDVLLTGEESASSDLPIEEKCPEEENVAETGDEHCQKIVERLVAMEDEIKRSNQLLESKLLYDSAKEEMINRLHKELQIHKDDLFKKILKPIFMDMIRFADNMKELVFRYEEVPDAESILGKYQKLRKEFLKIGDHFDDFLYNYGLEPFSANAGELFNSKTQQANKTTVVENPDENKMIVASLTSGYTWDNQLFKRESVHVKICEQKENK